MLAHLYPQHSVGRNRGNLCSLSYMVSRPARATQLDPISQQINKQKQPIESLCSIENKWKQKVKEKVWLH